MYTVTLELPDLCDPGDYGDRFASPHDAVYEFIASVQGGAENYVYRVKHGDGREWTVDLGMGGLLTPTNHDPKDM
jgi:hypothetical protein